MIAVVLAGCADNGAPSPADDDEAFQDFEADVTSTTGLIRGIVVDPTITPVMGATVSLVGQDKSVETNEEGAFVFSNLEAGPYFMEVSKLGFESVQSQATVEAGVEQPPIVRVQINPDATFVLRTELLKWDGIMNCQVGFNTGVGVSNAVNPCFATNFVIPDYDRIVKQYDYNGQGAPTFSQSEMVWQPSQTLAGAMTLQYTAEGLDNYVRSSGESPRVIGANETLMASKGVGDDYPLMIRVFASSTDTLTVIAQQEFEVFTTVFHGFEPDEDWMFINDGEHPLPQ